MIAYLMRDGRSNLETRIKWRMASIGERAIANDIGGGVSVGDLRSQVQAR